MASDPQRTNEDNSPDGNKWIELEENTKYGYIVGYVEGMFQGHCFTTWGLPGGEEHPEEAWGHATKSYDDHFRRFVSGVKYQQFFDGLNKLYSDHRNRNIKVKNGMWIVMSEISGQPGPSIETMIEAWRQEAEERTR